MIRSRAFGLALTVLGVSLGLSSRPSCAEVWADPGTLAQIDSLDVKIENDVSDGCIKASVITDRVSMALSNYGMRLANDSLSWVFLINAVGYQITVNDKRIGCTVSFRATIEKLIYGEGIIHAADMPGRLLTGGNDVTGQVANDVEAFADQIMAAILQAQQAGKRQ